MKAALGVLFFALAIPFNARFKAGRQWECCSNVAQPPLARKEPPAFADKIPGSNLPEPAPGDYAVMGNLALLFEIADILDMNFESFRQFHLRYLPAIQQGLRSDLKLPFPTLDSIS
jgi:hypothetical protein